MDCSDYSFATSLRYTHASMKLYKLLLWTLACIWAAVSATGAAAQWQWLDKDGRKVFSDQAPPAEVPEKNIIKRPRWLNSPERQDEALESPDEQAEQANAAKKPPEVKTGADKELEKAKAKAEEQEAAKKKAEERKRAEQRADNCKRAKQSQQLLTSEQRLSHMNEKGETEEMDEKTRAKELKRAQEAIKASCT